MARKNISVKSLLPKNERQQTPRRICVETLMLMAKYDNGFRDMLITDRGRALDESGIDFSPSERVVLEAIGRDQLEKNIDNFVIPGVTKKSLPNWRVAASVMVLVSSILFGFEACTHHGPFGDKTMEEQCLHGCWIDDDTYRLTAAGAPSKKLTDKDERKKNARWGAVINAQYQIIEKFKGYIIEGATGIMTIDPAAVAVAKELKAIIKRGTVISERFDEEDNCEILFEVKNKALKKWVQSADWSF